MGNLLVITKLLHSITKTENQKLIFKQYKKLNERTRCSQLCKL